MSNPAHSSSPESFNLTTRPITDYDFFFFPGTAALCMNSVLWELFIEGICWVLDLFSSQEPRKLFNVDDSEPLHVHMMVMNGTAALAVRHTALIYFTPLLRWVTEGRKIRLTEAEEDERQRTDPRRNFTSPGKYAFYKLTENRHRCTQQTWKVLTNYYFGEPLFLVASNLNRTWPSWFWRVQVWWWEVAEKLEKKKKTTLT